MIRMFNNVVRGFSLVRTTLKGRTTKGGVPRSDKIIKKGRGAQRPPFHPLLIPLPSRERSGGKGYYTLRVRKISTRVTITNTAPMAITTHTHAGVVGGIGTASSAPVVKVAVACPNTTVPFNAFTVQK